MVTPLKGQITNCESKYGVHLPMVRFLTKKHPPVEAPRQRHTFKRPWTPPRHVPESQAIFCDALGGQMPPKRLPHLEESIPNPANNYEDGPMGIFTCLPICMIWFGYVVLCTTARCWLDCLHRYHFVNDSGIKMARKNITVGTICVGGEF